MIDPDRQVWYDMLRHLRSAHAPICRQWFEEIEPCGVSGGVLRLRAHSSIHRDYLQRHCAEAFNDSAQAVSGHLLTIHFLGPEGRASEGVDGDSLRAELRGDGSERSALHPASAGGSHPQEPKDIPYHVSGEHTPQRPDLAGRAESHRTAAPSVGAGARSGGGAHRQPVAARSSYVNLAGSQGLVLNPDYTFDNFIVGPENRLAHAAAQAVASNPGKAYNPFFVHGGVGLGKTHLLQAICLTIIQSSPTASIYYTSCEGFMTEFLDAVQAGEMARFRHRFRDADVLVIDDIHFLAKRERTQEEFFHTFNSLHQVHRQIILSSDAPPEEIPDLEERLVSRFKWGLVATVAPPCYETRVAILKNKARIRGMGLPDDVACYVAAKIDSNIRELEGAIVKIQVLSSVERLPISLDLAKSALGDEPALSAKRIQIQTIIDTVSDFYGVKVTDLQSKRRQRSIALPRQVCMYLARRHTRYSLEEIGGYFGGRDHTTVMHAIRMIEERCGQDEQFFQTVQSLEGGLKSE